MRSRWQNFENKQSQKAIVDSACNLKIVHIEVTLWLLLAGITMSLSGCVVTYRDFPNATLESLPNHEPKPLYYHVEPMAGTHLVLIPSFYPQIPRIDPIGQPGLSPRRESIGLVYFPWCGSISSRRMRKTPSGLRRINSFVTLTGMDTLEERNQSLLSQNNHFGAENSSRNRLLFYHR